MPTLRVRGSREGATPKSALDRDRNADRIRMHVKHAVKIQRARAAAIDLDLTGVAPDDVVEVEIEDGIRLWTRVDDFAADFAAGPARAAAEGDTIEIPQALTIDPRRRTRGLGAYAIQALKIVGIDLAQDIGDLIADKVEGQLKPFGPGLFQCSKTDVSKLAPPAPITSSGPILVFLHGTASSTSGSFGGLWEGADPAIAALFERYESRVLALQHASLTKSPIENAVDLVEALRAIARPGAELHFVSHSRGGLIGELVARAMRPGRPFSADEIALFEGGNRARDRAAIVRLDDVLQQASFRVTRFVRVACPARGTTLADGRLDRYFSVMTNLVGWIPGLKDNPMYDALTALLAGVLKERTRPEDLPGLEAMMPASPLVRILNRPGIKSEADLHVIGGDLEGTGFVGRLETFVTALYYRDDHDLVVNTPAMLGGAERTTPIRYWIDTGGDVTHFHYFRRPDTSKRLVAALTGATEDYHELTAKPFAVTSSDYMKRAVARQPVLIVIPGLMGSELRAGDERVWVDREALADGGLAALADGRDVLVGDVIASRYGELCRFLAATHDVATFPYDWRQSIDTIADALLVEVEARLAIAAARDQPLRILAHSSGGLVLAAMLATDAGQAAWDTLSARDDARVLLLGTPFKGSHAYDAMLRGRHSLVDNLALLQFDGDRRAVSAALARFQGLQDVRPSATNRRALPEDRSRVIYVAGVADDTPCRIADDKVFTTSSGDGFVTWGSIPPELRRFYMDAPHGNLCSTPGHFQALLELLDSGTTRALSSSPPRPQEDPEDAREFRGRMPAMMPDEEDVVLSALGGDRRRSRPANQLPPVRVRIVHDDLRNATSPVLVGHYAQDVIVGSEAYLDSRLDGRLSQRRQVDLYPGSLESSPFIVLNDRDREAGWHPGAIVAGLGTVGELTPGSLEAAVAKALVAYALERIDRERRRQRAVVAQAFPSPLALTSGELRWTRRSANSAKAGRPADAALKRCATSGSLLAVPATTLLVGSGDGGVSVSTCVQALLRAVVSANRSLQRLSTEGGALDAHIDQLDILELYEDRAIEAAYALNDLARSSGSNVAIERVIAAGSDGRKRATFGAAAEWWQRIRVTESAGRLQFEPLTQTARIKRDVLRLQRDAIDRAVEAAQGGTGNDPKLGQMLFERMVPPDLKVYAPDRRKLVLMVDDAAAALPWELLVDRDQPEGKPLSVAGGMIRQLVGEEAEPHPRARENAAFVVGNPLVNDNRYPDLPGARREAEAVHERLRNGGYDVRLLVESAARPLAVLETLHEKPWRILHLAGHGTFDPADDEASGLVLADNQLLTPNEVGCMRTVPDFVFINCCHLGNTKGDVAPARRRFHRLAANLATAFIRLGARAVIAAGWAVNDEAARTFAEGFYDEMLAGAYFGDAVQRARERTWDTHRDTNTWGAYQAYGDPGFSLTLGTHARAAGAWVSAAELGAWADEAAKEAGAASAGRCDELLKGLIDHVGGAPADWLNVPAVCAAVAAAFGELGDVDRALEYYERLRGFERADVPLRAFEQLANYTVRSAEHLVRGAPEDRTKVAEALKRLDAADRLIAQLQAIGGTSERFALRGSLEKRRALLLSAADRVKALKRMRAAYRDAFELALKQRGATHQAYALMNALVADIVLGWRSRTNGNLRRDLAQLDTLARELERTSTEYWDLSFRAESQLVTALADRRHALDSAAADTIAQAYERAAHRGLSPRQQASVADQFYFLVQMAADCPGLGAGFQRRLREFLDRIAIGIGAQPLT